jgi:hypothetical protein
MKNLQEKLSNFRYQIKLSLMRGTLYLLHVDIIHLHMKIRKIILEFLREETVVVDQVAKRTSSIKIL